MKSRWTRRRMGGRSLFLVFLAVALSASTQAKPGFPVIGYLPMYASTGPYGDPINLNDNAKFPWDRLTHVMEAFAQPTASGGVTFPIPPRANLVLKAHQNNTRCLLSIGGAGSNNANWSSAVSPANRTNFVNNLVAVANTYGYDGIDIDWEFPQASDKANFTAFMVALGAALHAQTINCGGCAFQGQPKQLTFFGSPGADICGVDWDDPALQNAVDYCIYGGYDFNAPPGYNSPTSMNWLQADCRGIQYNFCLTQTVKVLTGVTGTDFSWPKNKLILALPLYDKQVYSTFSSGTPVLVALKQGSFLGMDTPQDEARYNLGGTTHYVNNDTSYCRKMSWALSQGLAGIGLWEITHAYPANDPAVTSLWSTIGGTASCINVTTPTPGPTPSALPNSLIDIGYSGNLNNLWGGTWSNWNGTGSSTVMNYTNPGYAASSYHGQGPYSIKASGTVGTGSLTVSTCLQTGCAAYNMDANGYTRIDFWFKASVGNYRIAFQRTATNGDSDHYGINFQVTNNNWNFYSFYLSDSSQQGWGAAKPKNFTDVIAIVFQPLSTGTYSMEIDDLEAVKQVVTPTPVPPAYLLDNVEDGNTTNNWGGIWSSWAPQGSSISLPNMRATGFPFSLYGPRYAAQVSGNNSTPTNLGTFTTMLAPGGAAVNLSAYNYINFVAKATSPAGTFGIQFTDNTFWITIPFNVPNDGQWHEISLPLSALLPTNITKPKALSWLYNGAGAYDLSVDDIWFENRPPTPTPTATPSFTYSATPTPSPTRTSTPTYSFSATSSPSPSRTPTATPTSTSSATPTRTGTPSNSPTPSATRTRTETYTPVPMGSSATSTPTISSTWTQSMTPTQSGTPSVTVSASPTHTLVVPTPAFTATSTVLPGVSFTPTATPTSTSSATPTRTGTPSNSPTPSATRTRTETYTPVPTGSTATFTPTLSATPTLNPTLSATSTPTKTATPEGPPATFTAGASVPGNGTLQIMHGKAFPNPSPRSIRLYLDGPADEAVCKVYTVNMQLVGKVTQALDRSLLERGGWVSVELDEELRSKFGAGTFYFEANARRGSTQALKPWVGTFVFLR